MADTKPRDIALGCLILLVVSGALGTCFGCWSDDPVNENPRNRALGTAGENAVRLALTNLGHAPQSVTEENGTIRVVYFLPPPVYESWVEPFATRAVQVVHDAAAPFLTPAGIRVTLRGPAHSDAFVTIYGTATWYGSEIEWKPGKP